MLEYASAKVGDILEMDEEKGLHTVMKTGQHVSIMLIANMKINASLQLTSNTETLLLLFHL